jgi:hypothetical protein
MKGEDRIGRCCGAEKVARCEVSLENLKRVFGILHFVYK